MSTTIKSVATSRTVTIKGWSVTGTVVIESHDPSKGLRTTNVNRDEFLAAVEAELGVRLADANAIVIARSEVHPVETTKYKDVHTCDGYSYGYAREKTARRQALSLLAYAEYMDAHPRVDEAQVGALSEILHDATNFLDHPSADDLAYTVIATGRVTVKPS